MSDRRSPVTVITILFQTFSALVVIVTTGMFTHPIAQQSCDRVCTDVQCYYNDRNDETRTACNEHLRSCMNESRAFLCSHLTVATELPARSTPVRRLYRSITAVTDSAGDISREHQKLIQDLILCPNNRSGERASDCLVTDDERAVYYHVADSVGVLPGVFERRVRADRRRVKDD